MRAPVFLWIVMVLAFGLLAEPLSAQQRTVAVVYDDSGSMLRSGRWWYGNYALQTLAGLLDENDRIQVVRMSSPAESETYDLERQAQAVAQARALPGPVDGTHTPYSALETAMQTLARLHGDDNWLLVITDGDFENTPEAETLREQVHRFMTQTGARVLFLLIGESRAEVDGFAAQPAVAVWRDEAQASVYQALGREDIVDQMKAIAAEITSRAPGIGPQIKMNGNKLVVDSELPLRRLTLLQQEGDRTALGSPQQAEAGGMALPSPTVLGVVMPTASRVSLFGHIAHLKPQGDAIPAGPIEVTLDKQVAAGRLDVLPEVAARLAVQFIDEEGMAVPIEQSLVEACTGDPLQVRAVLLGPQGDTLTQNLRRPDALSVWLHLGMQEEPMARYAKGGWFERNLAVPGGEAALSVAAEYPGYFHFRSNVYTLRGSFCEPPRTLGMQTPLSWTARLDEMENTEPLVLTPTANGRAVTPDEASSWSVQVVGKPEHEYEIAHGVKGWTMRPKPRSPIWQLTPTGTHRVEVELHSGNPEEAAVRQTIPFTIRDIGFWEKWGRFLLWLLVLLLLLWYLIGILRKPRFARGSGINYQRIRRDGVTQRQPSWYPLPTGFARRWLVPYRPERRSVEGVRFEAGRKRYFVRIPASDLHENMYLGAMPIVEDPDRPPERATLQNNETLKIKTSRSEERYTYLTAQS